VKKKPVIGRKFQDVHVYINKLPCKKRLIGGE